MKAFCATPMIGTPLSMSVPDDYTANLRGYGQTEKDAVWDLFRQVLSLSLSNDDIDLIPGKGNHRWARFRLPDDHGGNYSRWCAVIQELEFDLVHHIAGLPPTIDIRGEEYYLHLGSETFKIAYDHPIERRIYIAKKLLSECQVASAITRALVFIDAGKFESEYGGRDET